MKRSCSQERSHSNLTGTAQHIDKAVGACVEMQLRKRRIATPPNRFLIRSQAARVLLRPDDVYAEFSRDIGQPSRLRHHLRTTMNGRHQSPLIVHEYEDGLTRVESPALAYGMTLARPTNAWA